MKSVTGLLGILAAILIALAAGLRPDAFYGGDPGVKLIAALNAVDHPSHPFDISLPAIGGIPVPHADPFFAVHGEHAHAVTSDVFPVLAAPFLRAFGLRGAYVLPALGYLLAVFGCGWLAVALDPRRRPIVAAALAAVATPWLFYALELWEHTLAIGCAAMAMALFVRQRGLAAGLLFGAAVLLRAEAAWLALSAAVFVPLLRERPRPRTYAAALAGAAIVLLPYGAWIWMHFGTWLPPHLSANASEASNSWRAVRAAIAGAWFGAAGSSFWRVAPAVPLALLALAAPGLRREGRAFLASLAAADILMVLLTAPNTGGAQWGPRYLLLAYIPLAVLAADAVEWLGRRRAGIALVVAVFAVCVWIDRSAYRELRGTKAAYGRVVDFVAAQSAPGDYVATDLWWLDQIAAAAEGRRWLVVPDDAEGRGVIARLSSNTVPLVITIRRASTSHERDWRDGTCYFVEASATLPEQDLVALHLRHRCGSGL